MGKLEVMKTSNNTHWKNAKWYIGAMRIDDNWGVEPVVLDSAEPAESGMGIDVMGKQSKKPSALDAIAAADSRRGMRDVLIDRALDVVLAKTSVAPSQIAERVHAAIVARVGNVVRLSTVQAGLYYATGIRAIDPNKPTNSPTRPAIALIGGKLTKASGFRPRGFKSDATRADAALATAAWDNKRSAPAAKAPSTKKRSPKSRKPIAVDAKQTVDERAAE